ncbi:MAG: hypothetical protein F6K24_12000 [Okeania sp. SIO2D1]|nr:hypothetical protein [Okeania sp. SIO2D1]
MKEGRRKKEEGGRFKSLKKKLALLKRVYDINLNYLGVNPPLTPPVEGKSELIPQEGRKKKKPRV